VSQPALPGQPAFQEVLDSIPDPVVVIDLEYRVLFRNRSAEQAFPDIAVSGALCCYGAARDPGCACSGMLRPCPLERVRRDAQPVTFIVEHAGAVGGGSGYSEVRVAPLWGADGALQGLVQSSRDITSRITAEVKLWENQLHLDHLVHHDTLTGLSNRLLFRDRLEHAVVEAQRERRMVGLLFLDLDEFKAVNDRLGHEFGDRLLRVVAQRLCKCVRESDTVARLGGDEFTVILERIKDSNDAVVVARKIVSMLSRPIKLDSHRIQIGVSIGISLFPSDAHDAALLLKHADEAMYLSKEKGRGQYQFYTPALNERAVHRRRLEVELRTAVRDDRLRWLYEPRLDAASGAIVGLEAHLDGETPLLAGAEPAALLELAEDADLLPTVVQWVLRSLCTALRELPGLGLSEVAVGFALTERALRIPELAAQIAALPGQCGVAPRMLQIELPESTLLEGGAGDEAARELRVAGLRLAVSDFGAGSASLSRLGALPVDALKLAPALLQKAYAETRYRAVLRGIIDLAHDLGVTVIAPAVEDEEQRLLLRGWGCDCVQGPAVAARSTLGELAVLSGARSAALGPSR
jgi:diguanylate cyclase (GGDEF)-like protein